ncbi:hypothetical protein FRB94_001668 [Tulasnella sp. JGI-2019a]|nr:hypothetical protein FRB94_001668 [Tulasnella sp. JGI-2019a]KAG9010410.1 hypothetical protein FRB93_004250 [Tulasnella sp. JGI-2019a]
MGKKQKGDSDTPPNPNTIQNREALQRLNFIYQTSVYLAQISGSSSSSPPIATPSSSTSTAKAPTARQKQNKKRKDRPITKNGQNSLMELSRQHSRSMKVIAKKSVLRMDPSVKRTICKTCQMVLIPGISATVRVKSSPSHGHAARYTCTACHTSRSFPCPPIQQPSTVNPSGAPLTTDAVIPAEPLPAEDEPESNSATAMEEDPKVNNKGSSNKRGNRPKKLRTPRLPPLFQRDAGHVIFVGNDKTGHAMRP